MKIFERNRQNRVRRNKTYGEGKFDRFQPKRTVIDQSSSRGAA